MNRLDHPAAVFRRHATGERLLRPGVLLVPLLVSGLCLGCFGGDDPAYHEGARPRLQQPTVPEDLDPGWNEIAGSEATSCARGADWAFFVHPGTVNKVVVDFIGGGACWDDLTCSVAGQIFTPDIESVRAAVEADQPTGIYDRSHEDNPVRDWYHVVIPYCTGDIHWGDNVVDYSSGTISHTGAVNARDALGWIYESFSAPEQVLVTGCSAGSYGAALWAAHLMQHYPDSVVTQFGDSGAGVITDTFFRDSFPSWNAEQAFPSWIDALDPAQQDLLEMALADLYAGVANYYADQRMSQYNTAFDENQVFYFQAMGGGDAEAWSERMHASLDEIHQRADNFSSFIASGEQHCILPYDNFYTVNVDGRRLVEWLDDLLDATELPARVACSDCTAPTP